MKKIFSMLVLVLFVSGCALTTIRPPKRKTQAAPQPVKKSVVQKVREAFTPAPKPKPVKVVKKAEKKEEVLPVKKLEEKEEVLSPEEDIK